MSTVKVQGITNHGEEYIDATDANQQTAALLKPCTFLPKGMLCSFHENRSIFGSSFSSVLDFASVIDE